MAGRRLSIASTGASANSRVTNPNVDTSVNVLGTPKARLRGYLVQCRRSLLCTRDQVELTARGASLRRGSLWIVPDLWKTPRTRFPRGRWTHTTRPHAPQASLFLM